MLSSIDHRSCFSENSYLYLAEVLQLVFDAVRNVFRQPSRGYDVREGLYTRPSRTNPSADYHNRPKDPAITVWGGRMNLLKQVEPLCQAPTLGFLAQRHAHTGVLQFTSIQQWLKRASKPSRAMQGKLTPL